MQLKVLQVLEAFKSDIESFFHPDPGFVMNTAVKGTRIRYTGNAEKGGVIVSQDLANYEINDLESMMFVLLVLAHETAHLLNVHGDRKSTRLNSSHKCASRMQTSA